MQSPTKDEGPCEVACADLRSQYDLEIQRKSDCIATRILEIENTLADESEHSFMDENTNSDVDATTGLFDDLGK